VRVLVLVLVLIIFKMRIHGKIYDLEGFDHPGGLEILKLCEDESDCTALFESYHAFCDIDSIKHIMKKYERGISDKEDLFTFEHNGFYNTCKSRVRRYINHRNNSKANLDWFKTVGFSTLLFLYYQYILLFYEPGIIKLHCSLMSGITLMSLGYNILHDGSHYSISKYPFVNKMLSRVIQGLLLLNHTLWSYHHCIRHHQYTGMVSLDPDMRNSLPYLRKSLKIKKTYDSFTKNYLVIKLLLFNIIFPGTMFGQSIMYHLVWVRNNTLWKMNLPYGFFNVWTILQYLISFSFCFSGLYYGGLYFLAHIIGTNIGYFIGSAPDHDMYSTHLEIENTDYTKDWGEIQVRHSGNFMNNDTYFTKFYGGINFQIEHHLFPTLNNHKLKSISPIVQQCCKDFNIPYTSVDNPITVFKEIVKTYKTVHA